MYLLFLRFYEFLLTVVLLAFLSDNRLRAREHWESDEESDAAASESDSEMSRATKLAIKTQLPPTWQLPHQQRANAGGNGAADNAGGDGAADDHGDDDWGPNWRGADTCMHGDDKCADTWHGYNQWAYPTWHDWHGDDKWADWHGDDKCADWHGDNQWANHWHGDNQRADWHGDNQWADGHGHDKWADWHVDNHWADWHGDDWHGDDKDKKWATTKMARVARKANTLAGKVLAATYKATALAKQGPMPPKAPPSPKSAPTPKTMPKTVPPPPMDKAKARPTPPDADVVPEPVFGPKSPTCAPPPHLYGASSDAGEEVFAEVDDVADIDAEVVAGVAEHIDDSMLDAIIDELRARKAEEHEGGLTEAQQNAVNRAYNAMVGRKCTRGTKHRGGHRENKKRAVDVIGGICASGSGSSRRLVNPEAVAAVLRDL